MTVSHQGTPRHTKKEELAAGTQPPAIPTLGRLKQEDDHHELKASLEHKGPHPTEAKTENMKYHAYGKAVWDWGRKGVKAPRSVGGLALLWRKLSHTVFLASLSSEHTQGCEEILWVQESNK